MDAFPNEFQSAYSSANALASVYLLLQTQTDCSRFQAQAKGVEEAT